MNFLGIGSSSGSGTNNNGVFAFGVNVGGSTARKTPSLPLMLTPSPLKPNNRQVHEIRFEF